MAGLILDHIIVPVNNSDETAAFWNEYLGASNEGEQDPFTVLRINSDQVFMLAPWGTEGGAQQGPGQEPGARGMGETVYFFDPNKHLLEIRTYDPI